MLNESINATKDYFFAATYRKHDAIKVPAFEQGMPSKMSVAQQSKSSIDTKRVVELKQYFLGERLLGSGKLAHSVSDMPAYEKLSLLLKYSVSRLRFEPENNYQMHSAVPSPRSIFPIGVYIQVNEGNSAQVYRYDRDNYCLTDINQFADIKPENSGTVTIMLVAELQKIVSYYGDFSGYLIGLESGHLMAQISTLMAALNISNYVDSQPNNNVLNELLLTPNDHLKLMATFTIDGQELPQLSEQMAEKSLDRGVSVDLDVTVDDAKFPILKRYFDSFNNATNSSLSQLTSGCRTHQPLFSSPYNIEQLIDIHENRTSGNDKNGLIAQKNSLTPQDVDEILAKIKSLKNETYSSVFAHSIAKVGIYLSITSMQEDTPHTLRLTSDGTEFEVIDEQSPVAGLQRTALSPIGAYNYDNFSCVFSFSVNLADCIKQQSNIGAQEALLAVGFIAQLCIAVVTEYGLFSRPIKALDEAQVEAMLKTKDNIIYQLICGAKVAEQLQYRMA